MMEIVVGIVICGLCTYAATTMLMFTDGPFNIFYRIRLLAGLDTNDIAEYQDSFFGNMLLCYWCTTTWVSLFTVAGYILLVGMSGVIFPFMWFASIGVSGYLHVSSER